MTNLRQKLKDWNEISVLIKYINSSNTGSNNYSLNHKIKKLKQIYDILYCEKYNEKNKPEIKQGEDLLDYGNI